MNNNIADLNVQPSQVAWGNSAAEMNFNNNFQGT
jgi:hypothetical protein